MKTKIISLFLCIGMLVACNNTQKGAAIGAGGGALLGGIIGAIAGNTAIGAAVGGAVGAGAGAIIGKKMDKAKAEAEAVQNAQVESVTDANGLQAVKVTFDSGILFTTGSSTLSQTAKSSLTQFAGVLRNNADCDVAVQGYTDNAGWKNSEEPEPVAAARTGSDQLSAVTRCQQQPDSQHYRLWREQSCCRQLYRCR